MQRAIRGNLDRNRKVLVLFLSLSFMILLLFHGVFDPNTAHAAPDQKISFSSESGYYPDSFDLELKSDDGNKVYYTMDGSDPVAGNPSTIEYTVPIKIESNKGKQAVLTTNSNTSKFGENFFAFTPDTNSLDRATIIRAVSVDADGVCSPISTRTYFVGNDIVNQYNGCAVISLVTDPANLLDDNSGIYVNGTKYSQTHNIDDANYMQHGSEWERPAYMEFFDGTNMAGISQGVGLRIHGGYSRRNLQKSLTIYFKADYDYGTKNLSGYELIKDTYSLYDNEQGPVNKVTDKYKHIMLRNGGNDADYTKFQDAFIQSMAADKAFTIQGSRPCILYLNGEFWGLYNLTEKYSDKYLEEKFDVDNHNVIVYKEMEIEEGEDLDSNGAYLQGLLDLGNLDMKDAANYQKFKDTVDLQSFLEYYATEIYINNNDWFSGCNAQTPHNNVEFWRVADPVAEAARGGADNPYADGKWRYMLYDTEWSMGLYGSAQAGSAYDSIKYHAMGQPDPRDFNDAGRTEANGDSVFTAVFQNEEFRKDFTNALLDVRNWNFEYSRCEKVLDEYASIYAPLMDCNRQRWNTGNVGSRVGEIKRFLSERPNYILSILEDDIEGLSSSNRVNVTVKNNLNSKDAVKVNTIIPDTSSGFTGVYYKNYPIELTAFDQYGYTFDHWNLTGAEVKDITKKNVLITLIDANAGIEAVYKEGSGQVTNTPTPSVPQAYAATFVVEHATVTTYLKQDYEDAANMLINQFSAEARDSETGEIDISGSGQINFTVIPESGYEVEKVEVSPKNYKNIKLPEETLKEHTYRITKITGDITITVTMKYVGATGTPEPTNIPSPTGTPEPTDIPSPTDTPTPTPTPDTSNPPAPPSSSNPPSGSNLPNPPAPPSSTGDITVTPPVKVEETAEAKDTMFLAKGSAGKNSVKLTYNAVEDADGYIVYGAPCGAKQICKKLSTSNSLTYTQSGLANDTRYKYYVVAYKKVNGKAVRLAKTPVIYLTTASKTYTNALAIRIADEDMTAKIGADCMISSKVTKVNKSKKLVQYTSMIRYYSSDDSVASIDANGTITMKKAGSCYLYFVANNGLSKKIKVIVKE